MERECLRCHRDLDPDNPGKLCFLCADELGDLIIDAPEVLNVERVRKLLHYKDAESVRRMYRRGDLPQPIKGVKPLLWLKGELMAYLTLGRTTAEEIQAISIGLQQGYPIPESTLYGHEPGNLIDLLKQCGYLQDSRDQRRRRKR